jgi:hypothetical protein
MLFVVMTHLIKGLSLETLLTLKVEKTLICLVATWRPTGSLTEQQLILFLKRLIRNKSSRFCRLKYSILKYKYNNNNNILTYEKRRSLDGDESVVVVFGLLMRSR